jgi:(4S)-4-hydroxy-5-phosphonooxypentane-2,3-dione isomerase
MLVLEVNIKVKKEFIPDFIKATVENASHSVHEKGIARFDFFQNNEDPTKFILIEAYKDADGPAKHKETDHYKKWKSIAEGMMAEPRFSVKYSNIFPEDKEY